jgi:hypothetical protein
MQWFRYSFDLPIFSIFRLFPSNFDICNLQKYKLFEGGNTKNDGEQELDPSPTSRRITRLVEFQKQVMFPRNQATIHIFGFLHVFFFSRKYMHGGCKEARWAGKEPPLCSEYATRSHLRQLWVFRVCIRRTGVQVSLIYTFIFIFVFIWLYFSTGEKEVTKETRNEESSPPSVSKPERVACWAEGTEEESEMDSIFFEMGRRRVLEDFPAGM